MPQHAKPGHIRAGMGTEPNHAIARRLVERRHQFLSQRSALFAEQIGFVRRCQNADAERFCEQEYIPLLRSAIR